jgi:N-acetylmuramoyl-L-alanine amidase
MPLLVVRKAHGGADPGAVGNGLREADVSERIVEKTIQKLSGYDVTIKEAPRGTPTQSAAYANQVGADFYLSVHINAGGGTGFESYTHQYAGAAAVDTQSRFHDMLMAYLSRQGVRDRGKKQADFGELRGLTMPGILIEVLFIDNEQDAAKLKDEAFINGLANEIAYAVSQVMGLREKPAEKNCETCPKYMEVFAELQSAKQALKQVSGIAAPWMTR